MIPNVSSYVPLCVRVYVCMRDSGDRQGQAGGRETGKARHGKGNEDRARQARHGQGKRRPQSVNQAGHRRQASDAKDNQSDLN
jgi:hypothetical protein